MFSTVSRSVTGSWLVWHVPSEQPWTSSVHSACHLTFSHTVLLPSWFVLRLICQLDLNGNNILSKPCLVTFLYKWNLLLCTLLISKCWQITHKLKTTQNVLCYEFWFGLNNINQFTSTMCTVKYQDLKLYANSSKYESSDHSIKIVLCGIFLELSEAAMVYLFTCWTTNLGSQVWHHTFNPGP